MSLEEFILSPLPNSYINFGSISSYYRKGPVYVDGTKYNVLTRANTVNRNRPENTDLKTKHKRTGQYKQLDDLTVELAKKYGFDGIYVESVLNEFLGDVLIRYGYHKVNEHYLTDNYFKKV